MLDFFSLFADLTARFVSMDIRTLKEHENAMSDITPPLASGPYLHQFATLLSNDEGGIGATMYRIFRFDWPTEAAALIKRFMEAGASVHLLTRLVKGQLSLLRKNPKIIEDTTAPSKLVCRFMIECKRQLSLPGSNQARVRERAERLIEQGYKFYLVLAPGVEDVAEKHPTCLSRDPAASHIFSLYDIYHIALGLDPSPASDVIHQQSKLHPAISPEALSQVIATEWKFRMLKKFIVCGQMQVRVFGVSQMCQELLNIYNGYKYLSERGRAPVYTFFGDFIISNKLVDYIVGTGSHPELIAESGNIVGFLAATKAYRDKETDIIWHTIATSEDPRVVEATLHMQELVVMLYDEHHLLYYCKKAMELPLAAFTPKMRDFIYKLLQNLCEKALNSGKLVEAPPYELCVRLLQESSAAGSDSPSGALDVQMWAAKSLRYISSRGPDSHTRHKIYTALTQDIADKNTTSSGSICALYNMLSSNLSDLHILTHGHGLARLMLEHVEFMNKQSGAGLTPNNLEARHALLSAIIINEPGSLTADLGKRLWVALVGQGAPTFDARRLGWQILNNAAAKNSTQNPFLQSCFKEYLPTLDPECYQLGALDFTRTALQIWYSETTEDLLDDDTGLEQVWRMALTAPPGSIEEPAISLLVEVYVDSPRIQSMPKPRQHAVHLKLVNRCLGQLSDAAVHLQADAGIEPMTISDATPNISKDELCFTRSLIILREFLRSYQSKPRFIAQKQKPLSGSTEIRGDPQTFRYQLVDSKRHGERETLETGLDNTVGDLYAMIAKAVGFSNFKLYHWGGEVGVDKITPDAPLKSLHVGRGLLLVHKQEKEFSPGSPLMTKSTTLEAEIMDHFKELWDYLGMQERLAQEIYAFLVQFPINPELRATFDREGASWADVFPLKQPFKCLYAVHALGEHLKSFAGGATQSDGSVPGRSLELIASAIINREVIDSCDTKDLRNMLALRFVECLDIILQDYAPPSSAVSSNLTPALLRRLLDLLNQARLDVEAKTSTKMALTTFETIMDASVLSRPFWIAFATDSATVALLQSLLLGDSRPPLRRGVMKHIKKKCHFVQGSEVYPLEICEAMWPILFGLVTMAASMVDNCDETFELAGSVFVALTETPRALVDVEACLFEWARLLLAHDCIEVVGFNKVDPVARGLAKLLDWCAKYFVRHQRPIERNSIAIKLIKQHLFPPLTDEEESTADHNPVLNTVTRKYLTETVVSLTKEDRNQYALAMNHLLKLPPYDLRDDGELLELRLLSHTYIFLGPYPRDVQFNFDRSKHIRSSAGYCGLKNQSNTCYLNSLMTQLSMNPMFRKFMMNLSLKDPVNDQQLLKETRTLFGWMQNSYRRFIDPWAFISQIRTYEETQIDVNIQMDVDEFYNLLFDRWESQIQSPADKRSFRSFYGGQLVQQVKSKECPHISERLEPFSAIQCDIKGKSTLEESLQAYVDGEVMAGDNKYKCSTCDKHVNAVKRACLKDIPDNIIFHLKRFDFNLRTMQRSKINDYFKFPHNIDMRPYTVEHLMEPEKPLPNDVFELVGILVHAGTAESGHYYSYIRERPTAEAALPKWFEFNDDTVTYFDPESIESHCFGGVEYRNPDTGSFPFEKSWNAYMLFYQRSSVVQAQQQHMVATQSQKIPQMPMPNELRRSISLDSEQVLRKYLLNDDNHPEFILKMAENDHHLDRQRVSNGHHSEDLSMSTVMAHLDHVVVRNKDTPLLQEYHSAIKTRLDFCPQCAQAFLEWIVEHVESVKAFIIRCPDMNVRIDVTDLIMAAINSMRVTVQGFIYEASGFDDDEPEEAACNNLFERVIQTLLRVHDIFHILPRSWPEYFGLLWKIARLGTAESIVLIENYYLQKVLEILTADITGPPHPQYNRMLANISKRPATRPASMEAIICLLDELLKACDLSADKVDPRKNRYDTMTQSNDGRVPLNTVEYNLMTHHWTRGYVNILVEKLLGYNQAPRATQEIIAMMLEDFKDDSASIFNAIRLSLRKATVNNTAACIDAALTFLKYAETVEIAEKMYQQVACCTANVDHSEAKEHLRFYLQAPAALHANTYIGEESFYDFMMMQIPLWASPLLTHFDERTRNEVEDYLESVLFLEMPVQPKDDEEAARLKVVLDSIRQMGINTYRHLGNEYVKPRQQVLRSQVENAMRVIEACKPYFDLESEDPIDVNFRDLTMTVEPQLRRLLIDEQDQDLSGTFTHPSNLQRIDS